MIFRINDISEPYEQYLVSWEMYAIGNILVLVENFPEHLD
jgi:hypothetical protein